MRTKKRKGDGVRKREIATIAVDCYGKEKLFLGDPVEILEQVEEYHELIGRSLAVRVKSIIRPEVHKWIWRSDVVPVKEEGRC